MITKYPFARGSLSAFVNQHAPLFRMLFVLAALFLMFAPATAHASGGTVDVGSDILSAPTGSSGAQAAANQVIQWVYLGMRVAAIFMLLFAIWEMRKGQYVVAVPALVVAIALFFPPAIMAMAQSVASLVTSSSPAAGSGG